LFPFEEESPRSWEPRGGVGRSTDSLVTNQGYPYCSLKLVRSLYSITTEWLEQPARWTVLGFYIQNSHDKLGQASSKPGGLSSIG